MLGIRCVGKGSVNFSYARTLRALHLLIRRTINLPTIEFQAVTGRQSRAHRANLAVLAGAAVYPNLVSSINAGLKVEPVRSFAS
jgi:hypothetical protein